MSIGKRVTVLALSMLSMVSVASPSRAATPADDQPRKLLSYAQASAGWPLRSVEQLRAAGIKMTDESKESACHLMVDGSVFLQEGDKFRQIDDGRGTAEIRFIGGVLHLLKESGMVFKFWHDYREWTKLGMEADLQLFGHASAIRRRQQLFERLHGDD